MKMATITDDTLERSDAMEALLCAIYEKYYYDFRSYERASVERSVDRARGALGISSIPLLLDRVLEDPAVFSELLSHLTIQVSDLFRDPEYYLALRQRVVPLLATYPSIRIWVAGCGAGEEAYSIAIILNEAGLLDRSLIYATDIDAPSLETARAGVYDLHRMRQFSENYFRAGGRASLADYYSAAEAGAVFSHTLKRRILFSDHSLATDAAFAEVQLVSCRNVFIYFDPELRSRAVELFRGALCPRGFLGLGSKETLAYSPNAEAFEPLVKGQPIYRLKWEMRSDEHSR